MKNLARFLLGLFMPIILIGSGAAAIGAAVTYEIDVLFDVGFVLIGAGIIWGLAIFFWASGGDW